ncbi:MAG: Hint domain-containing protein [Pseudomonadota bacterium]
MRSNESSGTQPEAHTPAKIACFAAGTLIKTQDGPVAIEELEIGDMVHTVDSHVQPIQWIGKVHLRRGGTQAAIRIAAGALGECCPERDLLVSPNHRMVISGWRAEALFGQDEVLVCASDLVNDHSIRQEPSEDPVTYYHFMFEKHEIVESNGAPSESFHPGRVPVAELDSQIREELFNLFPDLTDDVAAYGCAARISVDASGARALVE